MTIPAFSRYFLSQYKGTKPYRLLAELTNMIRETMTVANFQVTFASYYCAELGAAMVRHYGQYPAHVIAMQEVIDEFTNLVELEQWFACSSQEQKICDALQNDLQQACAAYRTVLKMADPVLYNAGRFDRFEDWLTDMCIAVSESWQMAVDYRRLLLECWQLSYDDLTAGNAYTASNRIILLKENFAV